jgi:hypothetical protein
MGQRTISYGCHFHGTVSFLPSWRDPASMGSVRGGPPPAITTISMSIVGPQSRVKGSRGQGLGPVKGSRGQGLGVKGQGVKESWGQGVKGLSEARG